MFGEAAQGSLTQCLFDASLARHLPSRQRAGSQSTGFESIMGFSLSSPTLHIRAIEVRTVEVRVSEIHAGELCWGLVCGSKIHDYNSECDLIQFGSTQPDRKSTRL